MLFLRMPGDAVAAAAPVAARLISRTSEVKASSMLSRALALVSKQGTFQVDEIYSESR